MRIEEVMTKDVDTIAGGTSIAEAAKEMKRLDVGFLPVADSSEDRLIGVTTDRDIVVRCIAEGRDPASTPVEEAMSEKVLYCFADGDVESAARSMADQHVYRLMVLDGPDSKRLVGVISMNDIRRQGANDVAERAADRIAEAA